MGALASPTPLRGRLLALLSASLLLGCWGGSRDDGPEPVPVASDAETLLGAGLLPPDGQVAAADALPTADLPPDASAAAELVAGDDLPS
jgi:hypothetical protein